MIKTLCGLRKFGKQEKSISIFIIVSKGNTRMCRLVCIFVACLLGTQAYNKPSP